MSLDLFPKGLIRLMIVQLKRLPKLEVARGGCPMDVEKIFEWNEKVFAGKKNLRNFCNI